MDWHDFTREKLSPDNNKDIGDAAIIDKDGRVIVAATGAADLKLSDEDYKTLARINTDARWGQWERVGGTRFHVNHDKRDVFVKLKNPIFIAAADTAIIIIIGKGAVTDSQQDRLIELSKRLGAEVRAMGH